MLLVYVAHPYSAPTPELIAANIANAEKVGRHLIERGCGIIIPGKATHQMDLPTRDFERVPDSYFYELGLEIMSRCDILFLCPGWRQSEGCKLELKYWNKIHPNSNLVFTNVDEIPDESLISFGGRVSGKVCMINDELVYVEIT